MCVCTACFYVVCVVCEYIYAYVCVRRKTVDKLQRLMGAGAKILQFKCHAWSVCVCACVCMCVLVLPGGPAIGGGFAGPRQPAWPAGGLHGKDTGRRGQTPPALLGQQNHPCAAGGPGQISSPGLTWTHLDCFTLLATLKHFVSVLIRSYSLNTFSFVINKQ